jgi:hypothetical protein
LVSDNSSSSFSVAVRPLGDRRPPDRGDEGELERRAYLQGRRRAATERDHAARGVRVSREHGDELHGEADPGWSPQRRDQQPNRSGDLQQPGQIDDTQVPGQRVGIIAV